MKGDVANCANPKCGKQFIKKRVTQNCCGNPSCRTLYNRDKKGLPLYPSFLNYDPAHVVRPTGYTPAKQDDNFHFFQNVAGTAAGAAVGHLAKGISRGSMVGAIASNVVSSALIPYLKKVVSSGMKFSFNSVNSELDVWEARLRYFEQRKHEAINGISSMKALGVGALGAAAGAAFAGKDKKVERAFIFGALGAALGAYVDIRAKQEYDLTRQYILEEAEHGIIEATNQIRILRGDKQAYTKLVDESILIESEDGVYVVSEEILNSTMSGEDYKELDIDFIKFGGGYDYLLGRPGKNFYKIVTGEPGNGKTTYAVMFADYFSRHHGKVLYCPAEQSGDNKDFQNLLHRTGIKAAFDIQKKANILTKDNIIGLVKKSKYDLIVLDSVNKMKLSPDDLIQIRINCPDVAILAVMQSTKEGSFRGGQDYKHDCDVFLKIENFVAYQSKARSAGKSSIAIDKLLKI